MKQALSKVGWVGEVFYEEEEQNGEAEKKTESLILISLCRSGSLDVWPEYDAWRASDYLKIENEGDGGNRGLRGGSREP